MPISLIKYWIQTLNSVIYKEENVYGDSQLNYVNEDNAQKQLLEGK
jgi:hypothetical protein